MLVRIKELFVEREENLERKVVMVDIKKTREKTKREKTKQKEITPKNKVSSFTTESDSLDCHNIRYLLVSRTLILRSLIACHFEYLCLLVIHL